MNDNNREIVSLIYNDNEYFGFFRACSEVRHDRNRANSLGRLGFYLNGHYVINDETRQMFLQRLRENPVSRSISIDSRYLDDEEVLEILRNSSDLKEVRIIDNDYTITNEDLSKFSDDVVVICDNISENLDSQYANRVYLQNGIFKKETNYVEDDLVSAYFVDHELSDFELTSLVNTINNDNSADYNQISFRLYDPTKYKSLVTELHRRGLRDDVRINFLGNPLYDRSEAYNGLGEIANNPINITYDTCSDMVGFYTDEPFTVSNRHHSELEGGGNTNLNSYLGLLNTLEIQEQHIREKGYSPYETAIYVYRFLQQNYAYDPEYEVTDSVDYLTNRQLDIVSNSSTLVCEGYATLYSALMRRCGIPMFRYSTDRHVRNIGRIVDPKYGVDMIGVIDSTWDGSRILDDGTFDESSSFGFFMVSPRNIIDYDSYVTIPTSLVLDYEACGYESLSLLSRDIYESMIDPNYVPDGYAITMLDRMGFQIPEPFNFGTYRNFLRDLNNTSIFDEENNAVFGEAYAEVLRAENPKISANSLEQAQVTALNSIADRLNYNLENIMFRQVLINNTCVTGSEYSVPVNIYSYDNSMDIADFNKVTTQNVSIEEQSIDNSNNTNNSDSASEEIEVLDVQTNNDNGDVVEIVDANDNSNMVILEEYIPGTSIRKPRFRNPYETDEEYVSYLENYYSNYFPRAVEENVENNVTYHLKRNEIIQDLPIYSMQESRFSGVMTSEEIQTSAEKIGHR